MCDTDLFELDAVTIANPVDKLYEYTQYFQCGENETVVFCHCNEIDFVYYILTDGEDSVLTPVSTKYIADAVRQSNIWAEGEPITLFACSSGVWGTDSPAQHLANELGVVVTAPAGIIYLNKDGNYFVSEIKGIKTINDNRIDWEKQPYYWFKFYPKGY